MNEKLNKGRDFYNIVAEKLQLLKNTCYDVVIINNEIVYVTLIAIVEHHNLMVTVTERSDPDSIDFMGYSLVFHAFTPDFPTVILKSMSINYPTVLLNRAVNSNEEISAEAMSVYDRVFDIVNASLCNNS